MTKIVAAIALLFSFISALHSDDFEMEMGKGSDAWKHVQTLEDRQRISFYKGLYDKNSAIEKEVHSIPKVLHVIWLGPKSFPKDSTDRMGTWISKHSGWKVKFWTDQDRSTPNAQMEKVYFDEFPFPRWADLYYSSDNFGEKSEILRYAILESEGGVYIDHDMDCLTSLEQQRAHYDFFCGLEELKPTVLSSSVYPATNLIGSRPHHPICLLALAWLKQNWEKLEGYYPGTEPQAVMYRVKRRSFSALSAGIASGIDRDGNQDIIYPSSYFNRTKPATHSIASHEHAGTWYKKNQEVEAKWNEKLTRVVEKGRWSVIIALLGTSLNLAILLLILKRYQMLKRS